MLMTSTMKLLFLSFSVGSGIINYQTVIKPLKQKFSVLIVLQTLYGANFLYN